MKPKRCKVCKTEFTPTKPMQSVCSVSCALSMAALKKAKRVRQEATADKRETRIKLEAMKTRGDLTKEAQAVFNKYVRLRDAGKGCVSCGSDCGENAIGGKGDAGHFRSRGSAPHLRFDERNCHGQCKRCNRYLSGNVAAYRVGLLARIGPAEVDALEADQTPKHYTMDDLRAIKATYAAKCRVKNKFDGR